MEGDSMLTRRRSPLSTATLPKCLERDFTFACQPTAGTRMAVITQARRGREDQISTYPLQLFLQLRVTSLGEKGSKGSKGSKLLQCDYPAPPSPHPLRPPGKVTSAGNPGPSTSLAPSSPSPRTRWTRVQGAGKGGWMQTGGTCSLGSSVAV